MGDSHLPDAFPLTWNLSLDKIDSLAAEGHSGFTTRGPAHPGRWIRVKARGGQGVIIDGMTRDTAEIIKLGVPTFARGVVPFDSFGRDEVDQVDVPVQLSGVTVSPGDRVFADGDGVVVVPRPRIDEVVTAALNKISSEGEMRHSLSAGMPATRAFAKYGIL